jgi:hypothetical protein
MTMSKMRGSIIESMMCPLSSMVAVGNRSPPGAGAPSPLAV